MITLACARECAMLESEPEIDAAAIAGDPLALAIRRHLRSEPMVLDHRVPDEDGPSFRPAPPTWPE
jgi:hypothetical protein